MNQTKETKAADTNFPPSTQRRATNDPPVIRYLNGLSFVGRWWPDVVSMAYRWWAAGGLTLCASWIYMLL